MAKAFKAFLSVFAVVLFAVAAHELWQADWTGAMRAASAIAVTDLVAAALLIVASFLVFALYDYLAWAWSGERGLPFRSVLRVSFIATCAAMNVGMSALSGSAVRLKLYGDLGFDLRTVATVYLRIVVLFAAGWIIWLAVALGLANRFLAARLGVPAPWFIAAGCVGVVAALLYLAACSRGLAFRIGTTELAAPSPGLAGLHLAVSAADILTSAGVFHVLLGFKSVSFIQSATLYMVANTAGMASQVPGGLGVFEWIAWELSGPDAAGPAVLGGLLLFRCAFFWVPLVLALPLALSGRRRSRVDK